MTKSTKSEIKAHLAPYHERLRQVVEKGFNEAVHSNSLRRENGYPPYLYPRTFANTVFDAIARNSLSEFGMDEEVRVKIEPQTVKYVFPGGVLVRFKKANDNLLGQNQPTLAVNRFVFSDGLFPDLPADTSKVEIVWQGNEVNTKLDKVFVVARNGDARLWAYEIEPVEVADVIRLSDSLVPVEEEYEDTGSIVKPKVLEKPEAESKDKH